MLIVLPVWLSMGVATGFVAAERKGLNRAKALIGGTLLGPLAILLFRAGGTPKARCPFCEDGFNPGITQCRHCGRDWRPGTDVSRQGHCRTCRQDVPVRATMCPHCLMHVRTDHRRAAFAPPIGWSLASHER